ncbi:glycerophosphodiester phosphodiesterase family protein [Sphingomonas sp. LY160]|uniref:glycerophosphodiester phosphodiesterase family protein n=1 Tax=Sphingomonas sp. LY160 TaxID=3095342 RepID=UPI002ADEB1A2|nr:glycerophosphodiester phosphodiesterase family protein [Sphingomonas sp. LY160]MEA1072325.1 glycerophosphodiester phosphodiesterase family protein [Sphingomonas sp. LY160]
MRSSRSAPDPLESGPAGFAHRGLHRWPEIPENSLAAAAAAIEMGAGIECDLRLTADDEIVVFHDKDARRLCGNPALIRDLTLAEVASLWVADVPVPTLGQWLDLVDGQVPLLLEAKVDGNVARFGAALVSALRDYRGRVGVMSFDPRLIRWLATNAILIRRGLVVRDSLPDFKRWVAMNLADPHFIAVDRHCLGKRWVEDARRDMPVYSWTIARAGERRAAAPFADALIWEADGRP